MVVLGEWVFLVSEVPLYVEGFQRVGGAANSLQIQASAPSLIFGQPFFFIITLEPRVE